MSRSKELETVCAGCGHTLKQHCIGPRNPCGYNLGKPESCPCQRFIYPLRQSEASEDVVTEEH
jgi:hypothetical protein